MRIEEDPAGRAHYWEEYYRKENSYYTLTPSDFAKFIHSYINTTGVIFEFGCGSGRDSVFFASNGRNTVAIDACSIAINNVRSHASQEALAGIRLLNGKVGEPDLESRVKAEALTLPVSPSAATMVYARFFLHALTETEQKAFISVAAKLLEVDGILALEFRTPEDELSPKVTPAHYRRYVAPEGLIADIERYGFVLTHFEQGRGLARHGVDDAHVARVVFVRRSVNK